MTWDPWSAPVDYVMLGGQRSPGLADIQGADSPRKWTELAAYGMAGSTMIFRGLGLSEFKLRFRLYNIDHWNAWLAFKPLVDQPPIGRRPKMLTIWHPFLEHLNITTVGVLNVSQPEEFGEGGFAITVSVKQYRKLRTSLAKPEAAENKPKDRFDQGIENLTALVGKAESGEQVSTQQIGNALSPITQALAE